ncbi:HAD hydrolase-like protein [Massilia glaciei]|uniref:Haloacid dehalogenase n=1 Tax=Massilia glaciei TaxID=1524097 RepID=A0A2U2HI75_9BURK|nr:HAD hydrolase-like protein [Massilia glaciei]PWF46033.1 haloacid dehalogenase [Massilia glaciei]
MTYRLFIFDFDGTLADSFPFFSRVFNQIADEYGFKRIDPELAHTYRHLTPQQMMREVAMPTWKLPAIAKRFIGLMNQNAAGISLFDGVDEMLVELAHKGAVLAIVSSNSEQNVRQILGEANARHFSQFECGMSMFGKASRIRKVMKAAAIPGREVICIGDQVTDLEAAHKEQVAFGAVTWGYGAIESMRPHLPAQEFDTVASIARAAA